MSRKTLKRERESLPTEILKNSDNEVMMKKKKEKLEVVMEALTESGDRIAPVVGYFPSGYEPTTGNKEGSSPEVRLFRNKRRDKRLELVVSPRKGKVEFVGSSYAGEAAVPQHCTYALGILDKDTQTLKIVPIAANKIMRLEPKVVEKSHKEEAHDELDADVTTRNMGDLTNLYGTRVAKDRAKKIKSLLQQRNDPAAQVSLDIQKLANEYDTLEESGDQIVRNIPPHDALATDPQKAYLLDQIILKAERVHLQDVFDLFESVDGSSIMSEFSNANYPTFVVNRVAKLKEFKDAKARKDLACILSFISHLVSFIDIANKDKGRHYFPVAIGGAFGPENIPGIVYQRLLRTFIDPESRKLSTEKRELLIGYMLVLTLFVDGFETDPTDIAKDLKMKFADLKPYFLHLGCKTGFELRSKKTTVTLNAPLEFSQESAFLKQQRRRRK